MSRGKRLSRNVPCPCGSGRKYGDCCFRKRFDWVSLPEGGVDKQVPLNNETTGLLQHSKEEFHEIFGRDPEAGDRVFLDAYIESDDQVSEKVTGIMEAAGVNPAFIYAFRKTGLLVSKDNLSSFSDTDLHEWEEAVKEFRSVAKDPPRGRLMAARQMAVKELRACRLTVGMVLDKCGQSRVGDVYAPTADQLRYDLGMFCLARIGKTLKAIAALVDEHCGEDALALVRCVFEAYLYSTYFLAHPDKLAAFHAATCGVALGTHEHEKTHSGKVQWRWVVDKRTGQRYRAEFPVRTMAEASPQREQDIALYSALYGFLSDFVHPNLGVAGHYCSDDGRFTAQLNVASDEACLASMAIVCASLNRLSASLPLPPLVKRDIGVVVDRALCAIRGYCAELLAIDPNNRLLLAIHKRIANP